jgi:hypothetical protein
MSEVHGKDEYVKLICPKLRLIILALNLISNKMSMLKSHYPVVGGGAMHPFANKDIERYTS